MGVTALLRLTDTNVQAIFVFTSVKLKISESSLNSYVLSLQ